MSDLIGLIPAAGRGVRAYPYTDTIPKSMLEVDGVPLILRNLQLLRDQLDVHEIRIVTGHRGEVIRKHLGDGGRFGVRIRYVENLRLDLELPYSVYLAAREGARDGLAVSNRRGQAGYGRGIQSRRVTSTLPLSVASGTGGAPRSINHSCLASQ